MPLESSSSTLWALGFSYPFSLEPILKRHAGLGITLSGPVSSLRNYVGYAPEDLYSLRYGHSDSQFKGTFGLSLEVIPETLYFGSGLALYLNSAGSAEAALSSKAPTGRLALDVGTNSALVSGLYFKKERTSIALTYHQEMNPRFIQRFDGKANIGGESTFQQPLLIEGSLYFEPHAFELETQYDFGPLVTSIGVSYQLWSRFSQPVLIATTQDTRSETPATQLPVQHIHDTLNPRISFEAPLFENRFSIATGYQFRPSPIAESGDGGTALDGDTHIVGLSFSHLVHENEVFPWPFRWGAYAQLHHLATKNLQPEGQAPIEFSGNAYMYGLTLSVGM